MTAAVRLLRRLVLEAPQRTPDGSGGFAIDLGAGRHALGRRDGADGARGPDRRAPSGRGCATGSWCAARRSGRRAAAPEQRLREGGRVFAILTVAERDVDGRYLEILAEEGVLS